MTQSQSDLLELKNLGAASVNILHAIGINNYEDLKSTGSVEAYTKIKNRGINVSKVMLYALEGALLNVPWNELDSTIKQELVDQANKRLEQAS
ncbi:MAG: TfoX/Sxy family protein [Candidatus Pelagadaptatus aseana]|uniref:TfoX/Sxy family protein n=1 Tax=Candidatus Pelagadaptatus aseana TaxID=3120508 RepID=UPI0039B210A3